MQEGCLVMSRYCKYCHNEMKEVDIGIFECHNTHCNNYLCGEIEEWNNNDL